MLLEAARTLRDSFPSRPSPAAVDLALLQIGNWLTPDAAAAGPLEAVTVRFASLLAPVMR
jgi:hypothetical protein